MCLSLTVFLHRKGWVQPVCLPPPSSSAFPPWQHTGRPWEPSSSVLLRSEQHAPPTNEPEVEREVPQTEFLVLLRALKHFTSMPAAAVSFEFLCFAAVSTKRSPCRRPPFKQCSSLCTFQNNLYLYLSDMYSRPTEASYKDKWWWVCLFWLPAQKYKPPVWRGSQTQSFQVGAPSPVWLLYSGQQAGIRAWPRRLSPDGELQHRFSWMYLVFLTEKTSDWQSIQKMSDADGHSGLLGERHGFIIQSSLQLIFPQRRDRRATIKAMSRQTPIIF